MRIMILLLKIIFFIHLTLICSNVSSDVIQRTRIKRNPTENIISKPSIPYDLTFYSISTNTIDLRWSHDGATVYHGKVDYFEIVINESFTNPYKSSSKQYIFKDLEDRKRYCFSIVAVNKAGRSDSSRQICANTKGEPSIPYDLNFYSISTNTIDLRWSHDGATVYHGEVDYFEILINKSVENPYKSSYTNIKFQNLEDRKQYCFSIVAVNKAGRSNSSRQICANTKGEPSIPYDLNFYSISTNTIDLRWSHDGATVYHGEVDYFEILINKSVENPYKSSYTNIKFQNLENRKQYCFSIVAVNKAGRSNSSRQICANTKGEPSIPYDLNFYAITTNTIDLRWSHDGATVYHGEVDYFEILINKSVENPYKSSYTNIKFQNLEDRKQYCFSIVAVNKAGRSNSSRDICANTKGEPSIPYDLNFYAITTNMIDLRWSHDGATVYHGKVDYFEILINNSLTNPYKSSDTNYKFQNLEDRKQYCFSIVAVNKAGRSNSSRQICANTKGEPSIPYDLYAYATTTNMIDLRWSHDGSTVYHGAVDYFEILINKSFTNPYKSSNKQYIFKDLPPGKQFCFSVFAINKAGRSNSSRDLCVFTKREPTIPYDLNIFAITTNMIDLRWSHDGETTYNAPVDYFEILINKSLTNPYKSKNKQYIFKDLEPRKKYCFSVFAVHKVGSSDSSREICAYTKGEPTIPYDLNIFAITTNMIDLRWSHDGETTYNAAADYFEIIINKLISNTFRSSNKQYIFKDLEPRKKYCFSIVAVNKVGSSNSSREICAYTKGEPTIPYDLNAYAITTNTIDLRWSHDGETTYNAAVDYFEIMINKLLSNTFRSSNKQYIFKDLEPRKQYCFSVFAVNKVGSSNSSREICVHTKGEPTTPYDLNVYAITTNMIDLRWNHDGETTYNAAADYFEIIINKSLTNTYRSSNKQYIFKDLEPRKQYCFSIVAVNRAGRSNSSRDICANTKGEPSAPYDLYFHAISANMIDLRWSQDNETLYYGAADYFEIIINDISSERFESKHKSFIIRDLKNKKQYCFSVVSINNAGRSKPSRSICATLKGEPNVPNNVQVLSVKSTSVLITWTAPDITDNNGAPQKYEIYVKNLKINIYETEFTYFNIYNLKPCSEYCFNVIAINDNGRSEPSETSCIFTKAIFDQIRILPTMKNISPSVTNIEWEYKNSFNCPVSYRVEYFPKDQNGHIVFFNTNDKKVDLQNLKPFTIYGIKVRAEFENEHGDFSDLNEFQTKEISQEKEKEKEKCDVKENDKQKNKNETNTINDKNIPSGIRFINVTSTTVILQWNESVNTQTLGKTEAYNIYINNLRRYNTSNNMYYIDSLKSCSEYCFTIEAVKKGLSLNITNNSCIFTESEKSKIKRMWVESVPKGCGTIIKWKYKNTKSCPTEFGIEYSIEGNIDQTNYLKTNDTYIHLNNMRENKIYNVKIKPMFPKGAGKTFYSKRSYSIKTLCSRIYVNHILSGLIVQNSKEEGSQLMDCNGRFCQVDN